MTIHSDILAKKQGGEIPLREHLIQVAEVAVKAADYWGLDKQIAKEGAFLHDIGKTSPVFQKMLLGNRPYHPFRHEIASIFFLELLPDSHHNSVIEMIIGHHKSVYKDTNSTGIIDLVNTMPLENVFENHAKGFSEWSIAALDILKSVGLTTRRISIEEAFTSFEKVVNVCETIKNGWSPWRALLIGSDHYASALNESVSESLDKSFRKPDLSYYQDLRSRAYPLSLIETTISKRHTLLTSPTGSGKTYFLLRRCRSRVFYILPYQASINAMYERIKKDIGNSTLDIRMLHSTSKIAYTGRSYEEVALQDKFGAAVKILTPHQIAAVVFGIKGYESILLDLKGCDIILDEIHTYSNETQAIVLKIIEILDSIDCRVHIGTATMPTVFYNKVVEILGAENLYQVSLTDQELKGYDRHIVRKIEDSEQMWQILEKAVEQKKKVMIVCNTVARSQQVFEQISTDYEGLPCMLIHSRFKRKDRKKLEDRLLKCFVKEKHGCILVSTQVIEVSLDISFDLMITETAPLDSLIQRFGRINRHKAWSEEKFEEVYVIKPPQEEKKALPYKLDVLHKSYDVLTDGSILKESEIQGLLDAVYPDIGFLDINLSAVYEKGHWKMKKLCHKNKSALLELLDIDSVSCITEEDAEAYLDAGYPERIVMEIPVNFNSVKYRQLPQLKQGSFPFIVPDKAYSSTLGLILAALNEKTSETPIL